MTATDFFSPLDVLSHYWQKRSSGWEGIFSSPHFSNPFVKQSAGRFVYKIAHIRCNLAIIVERKRKPRCHWYSIAMSAWINFSPFPSQLPARGLRKYTFAVVYILDACPSWRPLTWTGREIWSSDVGNFKDALEKWEKNSCHLCRLSVIRLFLSLFTPDYHCVSNSFFLTVDPEWYNWMD